MSESCPKTQRYVLYLKTANIKNETDTEEAIYKGKNYVSQLLKVKFWWYTFERISQYSSSFLPCNNSGYFQSIYIHTYIHIHIHIHTYIDVFDDSRY